MSVKWTNALLQVSLLSKPKMVIDGPIWVHLIWPSLDKLNTSSKSLSFSSVRAGHSLGFKYLIKIFASLPSPFSKRLYSASSLLSPMPACLQSLNFLPTTWIQPKPSKMTFCIYAGYKHMKFMETDTISLMSCLTVVDSKFIWNQAKFHSFNWWANILIWANNFILDQAKFHCSDWLAKKLLEQAGWTPFHRLNLNINNDNCFSEKKTHTNICSKQSSWRSKDISVTTSPLSNCLRSLKSAAASRILNQFS